MLSIAHRFGESLGVPGLVIGAHGGDHAIYPDCPRGLPAGDGEAMRQGTYAGVKTAAPVHRVEQGADRRGGARLGVDYAPPVLLQGRRDPLRPVRHLRRTPRAFLVAGLPDPTVYASSDPLPPKPRRE